MPMCLPCNPFLEPRKVTLSYHVGAAPEKHPDWPQAAKEKETCATSSALEAQLVLSCCSPWTLKGQARICKSVASGRGLLGKGGIARDGYVESSPPDQV